MFKVIPITERPVHNQTMVRAALYFIFLLLNQNPTNNCCVSAIYARHD